MYFPCEVFRVYVHPKNFVFVLLRLLIWVCGMFFPHYVLKDVFAFFSLIVNFLVLHMTGNSNIIFCLNIFKNNKKIIIKKFGCYHIIKSL